MNIEAIVGIVLLTIVAVEVRCMWGEKGKSMDIQRINDESDIISRVLKARGVRAKIALDNSRRAIYLPTPSTIVYRLRLDTATPVDKVYDLQDDFCSRISRHRMDNDIVPDDFQTVVRVDRIAQTVEVNRPDPEAISFDTVMSKWEAEPLTALLGLSYSFQRVFPLVWKLGDSNQPHALIAGTTGSGKTNELMSVILSLASKNSPKDLEISLIDMKLSPDLRVFEYLPHIKTKIARESDEALGVLRRFKSEMDNRYHGIVNKDACHLLVIDELATLTQTGDKKARAEAFELIEEIGRKCREANMNMIVCTQSPKVEILGDQLKANIAVRLVGSVTSKSEANVAVNIADSGAEKLPGKGAMIYRCGQTLRRFQAPLVATPYSVVRSIVKDYGERQPIAIALPLKHERTDVARPPAANNKNSVPSDLIPVFKQFTEADGTLRRGGMAAALRVLFGQDAPQSGKRYQMESEKILAWHSEYFTTLHFTKKTGEKAPSELKSLTIPSEVKVISKYPKNLM